MIEPNPTRSLRATQLALAAALCAGLTAQELSLENRAPFLPAENDFVGPREDFLAGLNMRFAIAEAGTDDLPRAVELTVRTNQLNASGRTYDYDQLVPLIVRGPGLSGEHAAPVRSVDIAPTLAGLLGIEAPADLDGEPLPLR